MSAAISEGRMCIDSSRSTFSSNFARNMEIKRASHRVTSKSRRKILYADALLVPFLDLDLSCEIEFEWLSIEIRRRIVARLTRSVSFRGGRKGNWKGITDGDKDRLFSTISNPLPRFHPSVPGVDYGAMHHLVSEATVRRSPPHSPFLPLPFFFPITKCSFLL